HYLDFLFLYAHERKILYAEKECWRIRLERLDNIPNNLSFYRDFWVFYRNNGSWNDRDSSPLQGVLQRGNLNYIFSLRHALLRQLWDCPIGQWIEMRTFFDYLCDREKAFRNIEFPFTANDPMREKYRFMKASLERSLNWIGIVDTITVPNKRIDLFRLTEIGAFLLGRKTDTNPFPRSEEPVYLTVLPNLEVQIPTNFALRKQLYLARFTDDQKGRIVLTRGSLRRAFEGGMTVQEIFDFLNKNCRTMIPANVENIIYEVSEKAEQILIGGEPMHLEVAHQSLLDELLLQEQLSSFIQERSGEKKAILRRGADIDELIQELRKAGYSTRAL
ncbi:MAG: helicase-associated domain-containing protein, partial [bacterium]